jgi:F-type H+-transporting ATPase subunit epsilon
MALSVELVSPERILWSGEAEMVIARTTDGEIAFLTGHAPFIGALGIGTVSIDEVGGGRIGAAVHGGFVEVSNDKVTILSDVSELESDIDAARARAALERAEAALRESPDSEEHRAAHRRATVRIEMASQYAP